MTIEEIATNRGLKKSKKIKLFEDFYPSELSSIKSFVETDDDIISCFKHRIFAQPLCQHPDCDNIITISKAHTFSKGCCIQHSQEITFLETYGVTNPMKSNDVLEKLKKTNLIKFGVDNYFKSDKFKENYINPMTTEIGKANLKLSMLKKYGVENPQQCDSIKEKTKQTSVGRYGSSFNTVKVEQTNLLRYGVTNPLQSTEIHKTSVDTKRYNNYYNRILKFPDIIPLFSIDEYHGSDMYLWKCKKCGHDFSFKIEDGHIPICRICNPFDKNPYSKGEKELVQWIRTLGIDVIENDRSILGGKEIDIYLPEYNLAIEFNGLYWHSELKGKDRTYHLNKSEQCSKNGIRLIHVLDRDWFHKRDIVKSILLINFNKCSTKIFARNCQIKEISSKEKNNFLDTNHLQGQDKSKIKLGLFFNDTLVSVMTFGKPRFSHTDFEYELHRFANKLETVIIGGVSKLWNYFIKTYTPLSIISYSEKNWFNGNVYKKLGMSQQSDSPPNPYYFKGSSELLHRMSFQKHKLKDKLEKFDSELTAWENMQVNGYDRIWDCGNYVFEWKSKIL